MAETRVRGKQVAAAPGTAGNVLTSDGQDWVSAPAPSGSGPTNLFVQETNPNMTVNGAWFETNPDGTIKTLWLETGY